MKKLKVIKKKKAGRDVSGRISVRHQGGEHKRYLRNVDFKRNKIGVSGRVVSVEYDPNRTTDILLIQYADGEKRYILKPLGLNLNDIIESGGSTELKSGNAMPLDSIPVGTVVHNIELTAGRGGQLARAAGSSAQVVSKEGDYINLKLPSGEIRKVRRECYATIGVLGNADWKHEIIGKAGRSRNMGKRPTVRGVAQNPRSHPHGGGEGRSGIGMPTPKTYKGRKAVGKTRIKNKYSDKLIIQRRKK